MMMAFATSLASLACQGCVSGSAYFDDAYYQVSAAAEPSRGMTLAVPGLLGGGPMNAPSAQASSELSSSALPSGTVITQLTSPDAPISVVAVSGPPQAFSLTGSGASVPSLVDANLGWSGSSALARVAAELSVRRAAGQPVDVTQNMSLGVSFAASGEATGLGFDVGLAPRVSIRDDGDLTSQRLGGELRLGQGLNLLDKKGQPQGWYFFVGADGEALVWDTDSSPSLGDVFDVQVTDQVTVGDLQAGVSIQRAGGELSLSYIRREMKFSDRNGSLQDTEDFAGISFTMRR
nr:lipid A-modifier LpxR family protein [Hyphomonas sediminis]